MYLSETLAAYQARDPAARSKLEIFLLYPGIHALINHRIAHALYGAHCFFLARLVSQWSRFWTGIEIHPGATIGRRFVIDHGMGIVIGETAEIGDDVLIYQGVTLGGTGKDRGKRHPTIGNHVMIGSGAKILGPFRVGSGSRIASNAVVLSEVPENSTAVGVPARLVRLGGMKVNYASEVDQINITDPLQKEIQFLLSRLEFVEGMLEGLDCIPTEEPDLLSRLAKDGVATTARIAARNRDLAQTAESHDTKGEPPHETL